jgi:hypothetical protein
MDDDTGNEWNWKILLREISKTEIEKYYMILPICEI